MPDSQVFKYLCLASRGSITVACRSHLGRSALPSLVYGEKPDVLGKWALDIRNIGSSLVLFPLLETGASPFLSAKYKQDFCHVCQVLLKASGGANCKTLQAGAVKATSLLLRKWTLAFDPKNKQVWKSGLAQSLVSILCQD